MSMKLNDYMELVKDGWEFTCWDNTIDSEFYLYKNEEDYERDEDFPNVEDLMDYLKENLEIKEIRENGVIVGLYELLDNPVVINYAKENMYEEQQYKTDEDVVMLLFEDMETNISNGFEHFSTQMLEAFQLADEAKKEHQQLENENLKEIVILSCQHEYDLGMSTYSSIHASSEEALAYVDTVMAECDYKEGVAGEDFNFNIEKAVINVNKLKSVGQEISHFAENAQGNNKIKIDLGFTTLVAEAGSDPTYKEIFIGLEDKDGVFIQDLAVIGGKYDYDKNGEVVYDGNLSVKVYSDENIDDYTHDFTVACYEEEKEIKVPSLDKQIQNIKDRNNVSNDVKEEKSLSNKEHTER